LPENLVAGVARRAAACAAAIGTHGGQSDAVRPPDGQRASVDGDQVAGKAAAGHGRRDARVPAERSQSPRLRAAPTIRLHHRACVSYRS